MKSTLFILPVLLTLAGCGVFRDMRESLQQARQEREAASEERDAVEGLLADLSEGLRQAEEVLAKAGDVHEQAKKAADKDGDGQLDPSEYVEYLLFAALLGKQALDKRQLNGRIEHERQKRKAAAGEGSA